MSNQYRTNLLLPTLLLIGGILLGGAAYSYNMFHSLIPTRVALENVSSCRENAAPDDADPTVCLTSSGDWKPVPYDSTPAWISIGILFVLALPFLVQSGYLKWSLSSLKRQLTLWPLVLGVPENLLGLHMNFIEGTLTAEGALHKTILGMIVSIVAAIPFWYLIAKPAISNRIRR
jgi:hypothetical protein